ASVFNEGTNFGSMIFEYLASIVRSGVIRNRHLDLTALRVVCGTFVRLEWYSSSSVATSCPLAARTHPPDHTNQQYHPCPHSPPPPS
ncbi:hypothetical protein HJC23_001812, partial [Cyclotella cryptica]